MTSKMQQIENQKGVPIDTILIESYERHRNLYAVASELGVSQGTISLWMQRLDLEILPTMVKKSASSSQ